MEILQRMILNSLIKWNNHYPSNSKKYFIRIISIGIKNKIDLKKNLSKKE
jgi:hypothetical protein